MSVNIAETFELLLDKNNNVAYKALQLLQKESEERNCVYPYMHRLSDMLDSENSYIRTRGLTLLAYNAKWDKDNKIDEIIVVRGQFCALCTQMLIITVPRALAAVGPGTAKHLLSQCCVQIASYHL